MVFLMFCFECILESVTFSGYVAQNPILFLKLFVSIIYFEVFVDMYIKYLLSANDSRKAWNLVKELSGKKSSSQNFITGEDRLDIWKNHFQKLLNNAPNVVDNSEIRKVFDEIATIRKGDFDMVELNKTIKQMKNGKALGTDSLPMQFWKIEELKIHF